MKRDPSTTQFLEFERVIASQTNLSLLPEVCETCCRRKSKEHLFDNLTLIIVKRRGVFDICYQARDNYILYEVEEINHTSRWCMPSILLTLKEDK